ncbi:MAG: NAD-dependent dehydratase [Anaerolineae bacterium]|nr:MAG: NAD-dependent dehydratase [Anaerolineae bacterium]
MSELHIIFGTGPIGRAIAEELTMRGKTIRMVNRSGKMDEAPAGVEILAANLYDPAQVRQAAQGAAVVYQAAQPAYHQWIEKFPPLQQAILEGLTGSGAKLVLVENLYMYGATGGKPMTEDMPYQAHTRKGKLRAAMSNAAFEAHAAGKLRVTAGRGSDFFGPWGLGSTMGERVFYPLLAGKPANLVGNVDFPHTHTYTRDFARALVMLGERAEADGQAWHVPNDNPRITQREMVTLIAEAAGVEPKFSAMGKFMMMLGGLFIPEAKESVEMMYEFDQPFVADSSRFEQAFGVKATPIQEAIRETVAWYKSHPQAH